MGDLPHIATDENAENMAILTSSKNDPVDHQHIEEIFSSSDDGEEEVITQEFEVELEDPRTWAMNFYSCAAEGDLECLVEILDSNKVDVDDVDVDGFTALMIAAAEGHAVIVDELLRRGAQVSTRTHELRSTALHFAAKNGDAAIVEAICKQDPYYVDACNVNADTPLIWACIEGKADAVRVLLEHGADVNVVNQFGATTLICAVMIGEDPEQDDSDQARAQILVLLLHKNPKLVNFQDREGSTAMHLAASCGYIECVKTLLAHGADITLRNAIGQTPLEEAQEAGMSESKACVDHLRDIWQQLEEEAAARMLTMLEMEAKTANAKAAVGSGAGGSNKKSKKKNKKSKRKAAKHQQVQSVANASVATFEATTTTVSSEVVDADDIDTSGDSSDEDDQKKRMADGAEVDQATVPIEEVSAPRLSENEPQEELLPLPGVWRTVGKKNKLTASSASGSDVTSSTNGAASTSEALNPSPTLPIARLPPSKIIPFKSKQNPTEQIGANPQKQDFVPPTLPRNTAPVSATATAQSSPPGIFKTNDNRHNIQATSSSTRSVLNPSAPLFNASLSSFAYPSHLQGMFPSRSLTTFGSQWRTADIGSSGSFQSSTTASMSSSYYLMGGRSVWKNPQQHRVPGNLLPRGAKERWISRLHLANENVAETLGYLSCGICGDLVNDNLQCSGDMQNDIACTQLYCSMCLSKALLATGSSDLKCMKCHQTITKESMRQNHLAQAQAASLGLSTGSSRSTQDTDKQRLSVEEMQHTFNQAVPRAPIVDLHPSHLIPGGDLSRFSNGQLEVLQQAHQLALDDIMEQRLVNARVLERLAIEEWIKTRQDVLHFVTAATSTSPTDQKVDQTFTGTNQR